MDKQIIINLILLSVRSKDLIFPVTSAIFVKSLSPFESFSCCFLYSKWQCSITKRWGGKEESYNALGIGAAQILMLKACFSFRICDATLERRFYVWLPVPEWMQSCADPEMHRDTQEAACDHGHGRMQSGEEPDTGGGSEGMGLEQAGLHLLPLTSSNLQSLFWLPSATSPFFRMCDRPWQRCLSLQTGSAPAGFSPAVLQLQAMPVSRSSGRAVTWRWTILCHGFSLKG